MIHCENLSKSFRRARVLDGISLDIPLGERIALIGSNGAGKTTLIRCLLGEYTHDGTVTIDGRSPRKERTAVLGNIGFVPQLPPPLKMPVGQSIGFSAAADGLVWTGEVAGPDRLRFIGTLSRYVALIGDLSLSEAGK